MYAILFGPVSPDEPDGSLVGGKWFRRRNVDARITSLYSNEHFWLMLDGLVLIDNGNPVSDFIRLYMRTKELTARDGAHYQGVIHKKHPHSATTSCMLTIDGRVLIKLDDSRQDDPYEVVPYSEVMSWKPFCVEERNSNPEFFEKFLFYLNENGIQFKFMDQK